MSSFSMMSASFLMSASTLLLAALLAGARADSVTTATCHDHCTVNRARYYPVDIDATTLCLSRCDKTELTPQDLTGIPNVNTIDLSYNNITSVNKDAFSTVPKLRWLHLGSNQLSQLPVFESCASLLDLFLDKNLITVFSYGNTFSACVKIQVLSMPSNRIVHLHPRLFRPLTDLRRLYLQGNKLSFISEVMFFANTKLQSLELQENALTYLPSNFVSNLKRAGIRLQDFYFNDNPWQCACLLELLDEVERVGVSDYSARYDYNDKRRECQKKSTAVSCDREDSMACSFGPIDKGSALLLPRPT